MPLVRLSAILPKPIYYNSISSAHLDFSLMMGGVSATGGIYTTIGDYIVHTFTANDTLNVIAGGVVDVLVVGGGGAGGTSRGGGGGGGGVLISSAVDLTAGSYPVVVGAGGTIKNGAGNNGSNSSINGLVAVGGGGGGGSGSPNGSGGGSGGGSQESEFSAGSGTSGQGNAGAIGAGKYNTGGCGGGGGGASTAGSVGVKSVAGGKGGDGIASSISGVSTYYGGGGGGGGNNFLSVVGAGAGGLGGGGAGGINATATSGTANTGGGGGGGGYNGSSYDRAAGAGGSGIVIVRYPIYKGGVLDSLSSSTNLFILPQTNSLSDRSSNSWALTASNLTIASNPLWNGYYSINNPNGTGRWTGPANTLLQPGSGTFTIDAILSLTGNVYNNQGTRGRLIGCEAAWQNAWFFDFEGPANSFPTGITFGSSSLGVTYTWSYAFLINTIYHVAVQRVGTELSLWVNGVKQSVVYSTTSNFTNSSYAINGASRNDGTYVEGLRHSLHMLRMVKDAALFTSNFTPDFNIIPKLI